MAGDSIAVESLRGGGIPLILGLYRGQRFGYARALLTGSIAVSLVDRVVAEDLKCYENVDPSMELEVLVPGVGECRVFSICLVDKVVFDGYEIPHPSVFHVTQIPEDRKLFEAFIGRDLIIHWHLYVDNELGVVRSRVARRVRPQ